MREYLAETAEINAAKKRAKLPFLFKDFKGSFGDGTAEIMEWVLKYFDGKTVCYGMF